MTAHLHTKYVEGCYRCELNKDEAVDAATCLNCAGRGEVIGGYQPGSFVTIWTTCFACKGTGVFGRSDKP